LKSTDIQYTLLFACLSTVSQNQPANERPQKFATEPHEVANIRPERNGTPRVMFLRPARL